MKTFRFISIIITVIGIIVFNVAFFHWAVNLADTCLLWYHGKVAGWIVWAIYDLIFSGFLCTPFFVGESFNE